jgi:hypothetical protein
MRGYDIENRFFDEGFSDLKDAGYLTIAVSREFGGGLDLAETCREQRPASCRRGLWTALFFRYSRGQCWALRTST